MTKKTLLIIHTESHRAWGGQEIRVFNECLWMKKRGHEVLLIATPQSQIYSKALEAGLNVLPMSFNCLSALPDIIRLRRFLKKKSPDVLNTHGNMDAKIGLLAAKGLGIPCVIRSRHHSHPVSPTWYNKYIYRHLSRYIFTSAQCISEQIAQDLTVHPGKVITVSSGIMPPEPMMPKAEARSLVQKELQLKSDARFIGSVSMLSNWKGHKYIIDAFALICDRFPRHHLVIVGDGGEMERLKLQAEQCNLSHRIHFTGFRKDPWLFYRAFDMNILASTKNEATSQTIPQAMYAECPVIGTKAGGIPEVIEEGETGLLVEPADSNALAAAMAFILDNPKQIELQAARAHEVAAGKYTMDVMVDRILDLYAQAFKKQGAL